MTRFFQVITSGADHFVPTLLEFRDEPQATIQGRFLPCGSSLRRAAPDSPSGFRGIVGGEGLPKRVQDRALRASVWGRATGESERTTRPRAAGASDSSSSGFVPTLPISTAVRHTICPA